MKFEVQSETRTGSMRVEIVPDDEGGTFVIDGDAWVGDTHANRAVGRIGIAGLSDEAIKKLSDSETGFDDLLVKDGETGSIRLAATDHSNGLIAELAPATDMFRGQGKSINSFREFKLL